MPEASRRPPVPWLAIGRSLGRAGAGFLIASNFAYLLAPLSFLARRLGAGESIDLTDPTAVRLFLESRWILDVGDALAIVGAALLSAAAFLLVVGFRGSDRAVPRDAFYLLVAAFAVLVAWAIAAGASFGRGRGSGLLAVAATGGGTVAAALLLVSSLLVTAFAWRVERSPARGPRHREMWPAYAVVNLAGSATVAWIFLGWSRDASVLFLALALQIVLIPVLGVAAYKGLWDYLGEWGSLRGPGPRAVEGARREAPVAETALPPPPTD